MKIGFCSDLHIDFFLRDAQCSKFLFDKHFSEYFSTLDSKYLIIAGDLGHYPDQSMLFLDTLRTRYNLNNIFMVMGNHEGYLVNEKQRKMFPTGLHKIAYQQDMFSENGIDVLEGTSVEVEGITIGGANSFYDGTIFYQQLAHSSPYSSTGSLERYWKSFMNDSHMMRLDSFAEYAKQQKDLLIKLKDSVDVMVSHVKPVISDKYFPRQYQGDKSNGFYSFDFEEAIATDKRLQAWIYGHTHLVEEWDFCGVDLLCNPRGYPGIEIFGKTIRHLEVANWK